MLRLSSVAWILAITLLTQQPVLAAEPPVSFSRQIKPILSNRCFACHGPDEAERQADLRLDLPTDENKKLIAPGDVAASELIARIISDDPEVRMPPAASKKPTVPAAEVELLKRWVAEGAKFDSHWAYQVPVRTTPPKVAGDSWSRGAIDQFIFAAAKERKLAPSSEADRTTLLRRLSFDLTGLPPTPAEVDAFLRDTSADAYEKQVQRLLASKHFGERMALYWLDIVRYADTGGYHSDNHRDVWMYRDYVISAFNSNKPFDEFTREQLAGDLLPGATDETRIASGFNRLLQTTEEGGAQAKEYSAKYQADRVRNTAAIWLASTMGCCECHNHKFDPFTARDFYSMAAFFADVNERAVGRQDQTKIMTEVHRQKLAEIDAKLAAVKKELSESSPAYLEAFALWQKELQAQASGVKLEWNTPAPLETKTLDGSTYALQDDRVLKSTAATPNQETILVTLPINEKPITAIRLEVFVDPAFAGKGLAKGGNGNVVMTEFVAEKIAADGSATKLEMARAEADFSQPTYDISGAIDDKNDTGWAVSGHQTPADHVALFVLKQPLAAAADTTLRIALQHRSQFPQHVFGKFRLSTTSSDKPALTTSPVSPSLAEAVLTPDDKRTDEQKKLLDADFRRTTPVLADARARELTLEKERKEVDASIPTTLVSMSGAPRVVRILPRGNWLDDSGEIVTAAVPAFLPQVTGKDGAAPSRLDFANWMVARENPLTARVFVNRVWKLAFGEGLVETLDDFGSQGAQPTHPELLDYLAVDFIESKWNVKRLFETILTSSAYRQSSLGTPELLAADPANQLFLRQNRFRIDAEMVRDNALFTSGLLVPQIGGPSVKPYQPAGYWQYLNFPRREWQNDTGDAQYRRGLYTYWQRTFLHPSLAAFDAPSREECTVERPRSNTPQQALVLLNDPTYVESARNLAVKILKQGGESTEQRLQFGYRTVVSREARPAELAILTELLAKHLQEYEANPSSAAELLAIGMSGSPADIPAPQLAAWTSISRVLLNLHEGITRN
ncbi:protein of unknown function DUF1549 [Pirellula staleyi DSM 6068]|uniref:Cytochrome c domain-containing protein n=1 Tax=Pirellula staleyi (strain ATCC 27377 / DSM 6068 / ICPB 4128) TaxID=530564 RepID=D2QXU7_PIRSD|nr:PSD1 and planctomycete cytochrome C domain-containing protein [Pirellula staleyi]ADB18024.1 protein of unknown function DUF1549 [Pirellula staleyi DSM 6068]